MKIAALICILIVIFIIGSMWNWPNGTLQWIVYGLLIAAFLLVWGGWGSWKTVG